MSRGKPGGEPCPISGEFCRRQLDCSDCSVFQQKYEGVDLEWVCAFCFAGYPEMMTRQRRSMERPEAGLYKAGVCERCWNERIALMPKVRAPVG